MLYCTRTSFPQSFSASHESFSADHALHACLVRVLVVAGPILEVGHEVRLLRGAPRGSEMWVLTRADSGREGSGAACPYICSYGINAIYPLRSSEFQLSPSAAS